VRYRTREVHGLTLANLRESGVMNLMTSLYGCDSLAHSEWNYKERLDPVLRRGLRFLLDARRPCTMLSVAGAEISRCTQRVWAGEKK
jgi:hypothetical protein